MILKIDNGNTKFCQKISIIIIIISNFKSILKSMKNCLSFDIFNTG